MKFDLITDMFIFNKDKENGVDVNIDIKQPKAVMLDCYPDDWCRPQSGEGCCPGPAGCWPTLCTPDR